MNRLFVAAILLILATAMFGCDKERIVESTETVKDTQYIELPPDTIFVVDTVFNTDSSTSVIHDTVYQVTNHYDTVYVNRTDTVNIATVDTVTITNTVTDTVTVTVTDTVQIQQNVPNQSLAFAALTYYSNSLVIDFINQTYGIGEGYMLYLNEFQSDIAHPSANVWDIYGLIDFWTTDFTGFEPLEFYWRMTYTGGDPSDPNNWTITDPPGATTGGVVGGVHAADRTVPIQKLAK
jgi:hypothetical protein